MCRRTFLMTAGATAIAAPMGAAAADETVKLVVVHGSDIPKMVAVGLEKMGGAAKFFKAGGRVALKPNLAWKSTPEQGANTHPDIVRAVVQAAESCEVKQISIPENTCQPEKETFPTSGALAALAGTKAKLYRPKKTDYVTVDVPQGKTCKIAKVTRDLLEADCLVNMPVAKHHGGATLSISMKNWMGAVDNGTRRAWHRDGLHQCIADFSTRLKPSLVIIDATRILLDHGPQGPGKLAHPHEIIFAMDPVAADAYAATLFGKKPTDVPHIGLAAKLGVGCDDLTKVAIERVEV